MNSDDMRNPAEGKKPRRAFLKSVALASAAVAGTSMLAATPAQAAQTWKIQSVWDAGTVGYRLFEQWCNEMEEKTNCRCPVYGGKGG